MPLDRTEVTVQDRDLRKPSSEAIASLRCEADFRHEHNRLTPQTDHLLNRLHVDFGLAASGDSVQKYRLVLSRVNRLMERFEDSGLVFVGNPGSVTALISQIGLSDFRALQRGLQETALAQRSNRCQSASGC